ncbi:MAG: adenylate/guanylate cyclase domain-containing protein [Inquilinaceae bacterium]
MSFTLAMLVFLAAAPVIAIGYLIANDTAERLLSRQAEWIVDGLENQLRGQLDPVADQLHYVRQAVMDGLVDPGDPDALRTFTLGLLAGTPQVFGIGFIREDLSMRRWERDGFVEYIEPPDRLPFAGAAMEAARAGRTAYWAAPFVSIALGDTILNHRVALERDGNLVGIVSVGVTGAGLSRYVAETSRQFQVTAFVLAGRDRVVTYPRLRAPQGAVTSTELRPLASVGDPVIAHIWDDPRPLTQTGDLTRSAGHWTRVDGVPYGYYYRELEGYGPDPLIVGIAIPSAITWRDRWAATIAAGVGIVLMLLAAAAAWRLGRTLSRPAASFDGALNAIASLEFDKVALPDLVDSRVREWQTMARRLQSTARALLAFQTYLPRALVRRLFDASAGSVDSQERIMTVMFVDLEGFTDFSRARGAGDVAAYLNEIFGLIGPIVETSGGVIDKYTGDGLLAFWGAPDAQPDHAARACHAAADIARALRRRADRDGGGGPRLRIGLHSGSAIVGNIGFPGRIDYTLVGDTVNIAERTQAALRGVRPDLPAVIGATQEVLDAQDRADAILIRGEPLPAAPRPAFLCLPKD